MTTSPVNTTVKVVVSMVVVAALVATTFNSKTPTGLKGTRKLQLSGIVTASSQGLSNTASAIQTGSFGGLGFGTPQNATGGMLGADGPNANAIPAGTGKSFGEGSAMGMSSGFAFNPFGASAGAGSVSGGNSTSSTDLTVLSMNDIFNATGNFSLDATNNALLGGGLSGGTLSAVGSGGGRAGGNGSFGPSLLTAIFAATPVVTPAPAPVDTPAPAPVETKKGRGDKNSAKNAPAPAPIPAPAPAPPAPVFNFVQGLDTGGGGGGEATGFGKTFGTISSPDSVILAPGQNATGNTDFFVDEAYGSALSNGFGFGVGSGSGTNNAGETASGIGGASALGQGGFKFALDKTNGGVFDNSGSTVSMGSGGSFAGLITSTPILFGTTPRVGMAGPPN